MSKKALSESETKGFMLMYQVMQRIKDFVQGDFSRGPTNLSSRLERVFKILPRWSQQYELSDQEIILKMMKEGKLDYLREYGKRPNGPIRMLEDTLKIPRESSPYDWAENLSDEELAESIASFYASAYNMKCQTMFGISMSKLVALAKGSDEALFRAVLIDPTVVQISWIAERVQLAEAVQDRKFLDELAKSTTRSKDRRHRKLDDLRMAISILDAEHGIENVSDDDLVALLQTELGLIGEEAGDSLKAIQWHIRKFKESKLGKF